jgi:FkbM family methyltransferase
MWFLAAPVRFYVRSSWTTRGKRLLLYGILSQLLPSAGATFIVQLPGGGEVELEHTTVVGLSVLVFGAFEDAELRVAQALSQPGATVIDVGANVGLFSVPLARAVGLSGTLIAIEPLAENVARLRANVDRNRLDNVVVYEVAASDRPGTLELELGDDPAYASATGVRENRGLGVTASVDAMRLDDIWLDLGCPTVPVLKIDVEGAEDAVLAGATQLLQACAPSVLVECGDAAALERIVDRLAEFGYVVEQPSDFEPWNFLFRRNYT